MGEALYGASGRVPDAEWARRNRFVPPRGEARMVGEGKGRGVTKPPLAKARRKAGRRRR